MQINPAKEALTSGFQIPESFSVILSEILFFIITWVFMLLGTLIFIPFLIMIVAGLSNHLLA
jgi:hypothetical protein